MYLFWHKDGPDGEKFVVGVSAAKIQFYLSGAVLDLLRCFTSLSNTSATQYPIMLWPMGRFE